MEQEEQERQMTETRWEEELSRRIERDCRRYVRPTDLQGEDDA